MTNTIKYSLGVLGLLIILFLTNQRSQKSYNIEGEPIYTGSDDNIHRILFTEAEKMLELERSDTTWDITEADSFEIKENQVEKIFDRLLKVEQEMLISSKSEKWSKFGVDDSSGRHLKVFDDYLNYIRRINRLKVVLEQEQSVYQLNFHCSYKNMLLQK